MTAEARIRTEQASRVLAEVCRRLDERARANPELGVHVAWTETDGTVDFGWGRCTLAAGDGTLTLRADAADADELRQLREIVSRHLDRGHRGMSTVDWLQDGKPVAETRRDKRDSMRAFHRRMRHG